MGTCEAHHLVGLSEDQCWLLFKQYAFAPDKDNRAELVRIGKEIVKKCGGSPLAAQALGALLHSRNEEKEWVEVMESRLWTLPNENSILAALRLSYFHLSPTLKQCFAFCAVFSKDIEIKKEDLIHLWMANGFISSRVNLEVEDVGNMVWNELYQKSFFQDIKVNDEGDTFFKMHDLVHDLAQSVMGQECLILDYANMTDLSKSTHHIAFDVGFSSGGGYFKKSTFKKIESLRTLYQLRDDYATIRGRFPTNCSLRILRVRSFKLSSLDNLIHLRYLELYHLSIRALPDSVYSLQKLEILKLRSLYRLYCLPKHLTRLHNLRHLVIKDCDALSYICPDIRKLCFLKTLSRYIVSLKKGNTLAELHDLKLAGYLSIEGLDNVSSLSQAQEANMKAKKDLRELCLSWGWGNNGKTKSHASNPELVLEALQPYSNLKKLRIAHYEGLQFPRWIGMLSSLVDLELYSCQKCVQFPLLCVLPSLRRLKMQFMYDMKYIDDDDESYDHVEVRTFPSLEKLTLEFLPKLEWLLKVKIGEVFPHLSFLYIGWCPKLQLPCIPSLKSLKLTSCSEVLMRSVSGLNGLTSLELFGDKYLTSFPKGMMRNLTCLQTLKIEHFLELRELPDELFNLNNLEHLDIRMCLKLESLPQQGWEGLHNLRTFEVFALFELKELPKELFKNLNALEYLSISICDELKSLPEQGWEGLRSLQTLRIDSLDKLRELPKELFNNLNALEHLNINHCGNLEWLPEQGWEGLRSLRTLEFDYCCDLKSLPDGVRHLTSLEVLSIWGCPTLMKRCKEGTGEDWDKIAHVPNVKPDV